MKLQHYTHLEVTALRNDVYKIEKKKDKCPKSLLVYLVSAGLYRELREVMCDYGLDPDISIPKELEEKAKLGDYKKMIDHMRTNPTKQTPVPKPVNKIWKSVRSNLCLEGEDKGQNIEKQIFRHILAYELNVTTGGGNKERKTSRGSLSILMSFVHANNCDLIYNRSDKVESGDDYESMSDIESIDSEESEHGIDEKLESTVPRLIRGQYRGNPGGSQYQRTTNLKFFEKNAKASLRQFDREPVEDKVTYQFKDVALIVFGKNVRPSLVETRREKLIGGATKRQTNVMKEIELSKWNLHLEMKYDEESTPNSRYSPNKKSSKQDAIDQGTDCLMCLHSLVDTYGDQISEPVKAGITQILVNASKKNGIIANSTLFINKRKAEKIQNAKDNNEDDNNGDGKLSLAYLSSKTYHNPNFARIERKVMTSAKKAEQVKELNVTHYETDEVRNIIVDNWYVCDDVLTDDENNFYARVNNEAYGEIEMTFLDDNDNTEQFKYVTEETLDAMKMIVLGWELMDEEKSDDGSRRVHLRRKVQGTQH